MNIKIEIKDTEKIDQFTNWIGSDNVLQGIEFCVMLMDNNNFIHPVYVTKNSSSHTYCIVSSELFFHKSVRDNITIEELNGYLKDIINNILKVLYIDVDIMYHIGRMGIAYKDERKRLWMGGKYNIPKKVINTKKITVVKTECYNLQFEKEKDRNEYIDEALQRINNTLEAGINKNKKCKLELKKDIQKGISIDGKYQVSIYFVIYDTSGYLKNSSVISF
jgi:hypothetical protein